MKNTRYKAPELRPGVLVTLHDGEDAQVYTVKGFHNLNVYLVWFEGTRKCGSWSDYSYCRKPTLEQIQYSINTRGRLANLKDVTEVADMTHEQGQAAIV